MKRAADSVVLNIAEGSTGQSKAKRYLKWFLDTRYDHPSKW
ncbi:MULTISPECIES: four helix bundle protein [unclassified Mucilaginibacter]|nr:MULTISPECIES: four helix bundle protein [unclassified Mucilaginibacter]MEB0260239.1 four helix bundle protein [Mucilaginibacter sp. 10I4]MEB0277350.1 four helix bundle protein [Mucilaginibacter sp. 10B2]MEB0300168.1 four helix bundle protein [Mucilaginibacter sp. 5C4]WPX25714.1 four helix bundle protein [Mucilaginibacter sp. 5C4]